MSARATASWSAAAMVIVIAGNNPVYRVLVALAAVNLLLAARRPGRSIRGLLLLVLVAGLFSITLNLLLSHGGTHVLARLPTWLPGIGGPVSLETTAGPVFVTYDEGCGCRSPLRYLDPPVGW